MNRTGVYFLGLFLTLLLISPCSGQQEGEGQELESTVITADRMEYLHDQRTVRFSGNVRVERPDFDLESQRLTVVFVEGAGMSGVQSDTGQAEKIERIIAEGDVSFDHQGRVGRCQRAVYMVQEETLRMEGNPRIEDGRNMISGEVITFSLKDNRSEILGGESSRVEAVFFAPAPGEEQ